MRVEYRKETDDSERLWFVCPGCKMPHSIIVKGGNYPMPVWTWNQNINAPTIKPSLLVKQGNMGRNGICHSFITDGEIQFLNDSTHKFAGKTIELSEITNSIFYIED